MRYGCMDWWGVLFVGIARSPATKVHIVAKACENVNQYKACELGKPRALTSV